MHIKQIIGAAIFLLIVVGGIVYFAGPMYLPKEPDTGAILNTMIANDPVFAQGVSSYDSKDYVTAAEQLQKTLTTKTDPIEEGIVQFYLAASLEKSAQYEKAVANLKEIVASPEHIPLIRATAIQNMSQMYYRYGDQRITAAIFSDNPYKNLVGSNNAISYRNLFTLAVSLYPLAYSEYAIAQWYAFELGSAKEDSDRARENSARDVVRNALAAAELDMLRLKEDARAGKPSDYVLASNMRARTYGALSIEGETDYDADDAYRQAISDYVEYSEPEGFVRLNYAMYMATKSGNSRAADIRTVLAPLYVGALDSHAAGLSAFLRNQGARPASRTHLAKLANIDPQFKDLLLANGWKESYFQ